MQEPPLDDSEIKKLRQLLAEFIVFRKEEVIQLKKLIEAYRHTTWVVKMLTNVLLWGTTIGFGLPQIIQLMKG